MMDAGKPPRPWHRRKRTWAAVLLLTAAYPASVGPLGYCVFRGWVPMAPANAYIAPLEAIGDTPGRAFGTYVNWWVDLGRWHASRADSD